MTARDPGGTPLVLESDSREVLADLGVAAADYPLRRFLHRFGALRSTRPGQACEERLGQLVADAGEESGAAAARVLAAWRMFSGSFEASQAAAICGDQPLCRECQLREQCQFFHRRPTLRDLPENERPRERLIHQGEDSLSSAELLGIILRDGTRQHSAIDLGQKLLSRFGNLRSLSTRTIAELCEVQGIGPAKATQIKAALTLGRRMAEANGFQPGEPLGNSREVFARYHAHLRDLKKEVFQTVLLDRKNRVLRELVVSVGSLSASIVHPREVLNPAIRESAAAMICVHNHPSGDPKPSPEDLEITRRLEEACRIMGIAFLDHIIIGDGCFFSFADEGLIKPD